MRHAVSIGAYSTSAAGQRASWIVRFARQANYVFSEINWANKRMTALMLSYGVESDLAPDTCGGGQQARKTERPAAGGHVPSTHPAARRLQAYWVATASIRRR